jgi:Hint-domain
MANGSLTAVSKLKKGDRVLSSSSSSGGRVAEVVCVVGMGTGRSETEQVIRFPTGLVITPDHLVLHGGTYTLPKEMFEAEMYGCKLVFNVLLDTEHTLLVNGVTCVALGHWRTGRTAHPFWGDWEGIKRCPEGADADGFRAGYVEVKGVVRETHTRRACGLKTLGGRSISV